MGFDWECYLSLGEVMKDTAKKLQGDFTQECLREACLRSALSRFYYGVFGVAENTLSHYVEVPRVNTHKFVICEYETAPDQPVKKVGENLKRLWRVRKQADYDDEMKDERHKTMSLDDISSEVEKANQKARNTVKQIKKLKSDGFISSSTFSEERC